MYAIEALRLCKSFGSVRAVDGVSFQVKEGEIFGLLGPNGAGKTTTIRMLIGLSKPDEGEVRIFGYNPHSDPVKARMMIGVVPEEANPYPDLTVWDNLVLIGLLYGLPKREIKKRANELIELLGLHEVKKRKAKNLSKGLKQRLLIAMALINNPRVLFLDEPTSGLDVLSARKVREFIVKLRDEDVTVLLTTHNIEEAGLLCDRIAIMNKGRIIALGSPEELKVRIDVYIYVSIVFEGFIEGFHVNAQGLLDVKIQGNKLLAVCSNPLEVAEIIACATELSRRMNLKILDIKVNPPTLEEVFVKLVGSTG